MEALPGMMDTPVVAPGLPHRLIAQAHEMQTKKQTSDHIEMGLYSCSILDVVSQIFCILDRCGGIFLVLGRKFSRDNLNLYDIPV